MTENETIQTDRFEIARLELRAEDILIIKPQRLITIDKAMRLEARIKERVSEGVKLIVFTEPVDLAVLSPKVKVFNRCSKLDCPAPKGLCLERVDSEYLECEHWESNKPVAGQTPRVPNFDDEFSQSLSQITRRG